MVEKVPMTIGGFQSLEKELKQLKHTDRQAVIKAIEEARAHGDLKENAEYHAAKDQQGFIESRIKDLESKISLSEVIDPATMGGDKVLFSATVTIADEDDAETTYQIVGTDEVDVSNGKISYSSPIGRAMIGRRVGDEFEVKAPDGEIYYEITKVAFI